MRNVVNPRIVEYKGIPRKVWIVDGRSYGDKEVRHKFGLKKLVEIGVITDPIEIARRALKERMYGKSK